MNTHQNWNDYAGDWQQSATGAQDPLFRAIAALVPQGASVLDVGCGTALLRPYLSGPYIGVEPSALAIAQKAPNVCVIQSTAEDFRPYRTFSRIVFIESLYYSADPIALLKQYARYLAPGGRIIASVYQRKKRQMGVRAWIKAVFTLRLPMTNKRCTRLIERYLARHAIAHTRQSVPMASGEEWVVWVIGAGRGSSV